MAFSIFIAFSLFLGGTLGELVCEDLPVGMCSYSISSSGKRCVLETSEAEDGITDLQCQTSEVVAHSMKEHIENEQCIDACGLERLSIGISTDSLAETNSVRSLCSADCYQHCPNIIDLFDTLALAEGASLHARCKTVQSRSQPLQSFVAETPTALADPPVSSNEPPVMVADPPVSATDPPVMAADPPISTTAPTVTDPLL
ncbi:hypothetical protein LIER_03115 [Lithospermum erythrorhizon]|uniref:PAR1 protein n=1 Tax=Lithospermum erythrorhizon TaxID=34254 RepID=A0AAV3NTA0_LITER